MSEPKTPKEALEAARGLALFLRSSGRPKGKPGELVQSLPPRHRRLLENLVAADVLDVRSDQVWDDEETEEAKELSQLKRLVDRQKKFHP